MEPIYYVIRECQKNGKILQRRVTLEEADEILKRAEKRGKKRTISKIPVYPYGVAFDGDESGHGVGGEFDG